MRGHLKTLKHLVVLALLGSMLLLTGCGMYRAPVMPPQGLFISTFKAPLTVNFNDTPVSVDLIHASKKKTHYFHDILFTWLDFAWGEVDVPQIARSAGITKVSYAEYEILSILPIIGLYAEFTVHVYGYSEGH